MSNDISTGKSTRNRVFSRKPHFSLILLSQLWLSCACTFESGLLKRIIMAAVATITAITLVAKAELKRNHRISRAYHLCKEKIKKDCSGKKSKSFSNRYPASFISSIMAFLGT
jgi:hypothetical protein